MTKKYLAQKEMAESLARKLTKDDCSESSCKQHFWSPMHRDSHRILYPSHFSGDVVVVVEKEDFVATDFKPRFRKVKKK